MRAVLRSLGWISAIVVAIAATIFTGLDSAGATIAVAALGLAFAMVTIPLSTVWDDLALEEAIAARDAQRARAILAAKRGKEAEGAPPQWLIPELRVLVVEQKWIEAARTLEQLGPDAAIDPNVRAATRSIERREPEARSAAKDAREVAKIVTARAAISAAVAAIAFAATAFGSHRVLAVSVAAVSLPAVYLALYVAKRRRLIADVSLENHPADVLRGVERLWAFDVGGAHSRALREATALHRLGRPQDAFELLLAIDRSKLYPLQERLEFEQTATAVTRDLGSPEAVEFAEEVFGVVER